MLGDCVAGALALLYFLGTIRTGLFKDDTAYYGRLAEDLADPARLPYTFRLFTPWLVSLLPTDTASGFAIVTGAALWGATMLLNAFLASFGCSPFARRSALVIFLLSPVVIRMLTTPTYVDPVTYVLTMASLLALQHRRDGWFCLLVSLSVLNRETALLLLPSFVIVCWQTDGARTLLRPLLLCVVPVVALAALVLGKLAVLGLLGEGLSGLMSLRYTGYVQRIPRLGDLLDLYSLFGAGWLTILLAWRSAPSWLLLYGGLIVAQLTISRGDESRNLSHLFPLMLLLVALILDHVRTAARNREEGRRIAGALVLALVASTVHFRWAFISSDVLRYVLVGLGSVGGLALLVWLCWKERQVARVSGAAGSTPVG